MTRKKVLQTTIAEALAKIQQAGQDNYQADVGILWRYIQKAENIVWFDLGRLFGNTVPFAELEDIATEVSERLEFKAYDEVQQRVDEKVALWASESNMVENVIHLA